MALQVELIPTGEIIRVVHPHKPCKLVSWDALGWEEGWQCLPRAQQPHLKQTPLGRSEQWGQVLILDATGIDWTRRVNGRKEYGFKCTTRSSICQSEDLGLNPFPSCSLILRRLGYELGHKNTLVTGLL